MKKSLLLIYLLILLFSCRDSKQGEITSSSNTIENFTGFFNKFKSDSSFQVSRIQFPINAWGYNEDPESPIGTDDSLIINYTFTLQNYTFFSFEENTGQLYDNYIVEAEAKENIATVSLSGVDNGISVEYHFAKINGLWYMVKIVDQST